MFRIFIVLRSFISPSGAQHRPYIGPKRAPKSTQMGVSDWPSHSLFGFDVGKPRKTDLGPFWDPLGPLLGPSWVHLGAILGQSWAILGPSRAIWGHLGVILGHLGNTLGDLWHICGIFGHLRFVSTAFWGYVRACLEHFRQSLLHLAPFSDTSYVQVYIHSLVVFRHTQDTRRRSPPQARFPFPCLDRFILRPLGALLGLS